MKGTRATAEDIFIACKLYDCLSQVSGWFWAGKTELQRVWRIHTEEKRSETRNTLWQGEGYRRRTLSASVVGPTAVGRRLLTSKFQTGAQQEKDFFLPQTWELLSLGVVEMDLFLGIASQRSQKSPLYIRPILIIEYYEMTVLKHIQMDTTCIQRCMAVSFSVYSNTSSVCYLLHSTE